MTAAQQKQLSSRAKQEWQNAGAKGNSAWSAPFTKANRPPSLFHSSPQTNENDLLTRGLSIYQHVNSSLDGGPRGIHPPTLICALGAIAGYAAKRVVVEQVARGEIENDFKRLNTSRNHSVIVSEQVNKLVLTLNGSSVAAIVVAAAMRCGLKRVPDMNELLHRHLTTPVSKQTARDSTLSDVPAETLLMMYWESIARFFRQSPDDLCNAHIAAAHAAAEAIDIYRKVLAPDISLNIVLETAIVTSKIDRAF